MRRVDRTLRALALAVLAASFGHAAEPADRSEAPHRYRARIDVQQPAPLVLLPLPVSAYERSQPREPIADLRIVDADGRRVPFAVLPPHGRPTTPAKAATPSPQAAVLYPLPRTAPGHASEPNGMAIELRGGQVRIRPQPAAAGTAPASPGWLIDLGARAKARAGRRVLRVTWSGPAEFSAPFDLDVGDDLQHWSAVEGGQLMALSAPTGALTQREITLPAASPRFVRLLWREGATVPALTSAELVATPPAAAEPVEDTTPLSFSGSPEPASAAAATQPAPDALHVDLGAPLPVVQLDLDVGPGTHVAPLRVQGRATLDQPWRDLAQGVFYRLERGPQVSGSPPFRLDGAPLRYLRLVTDDRTPPLDIHRTQVLVQARLASLVFAAQGRAPYALLAGAPRALPSALPLATLVPSLDDERPRFGHAAIGPWTEVAEAVQQADAAERRAARRPWLLWTVLLAGVAGLGAMVWRMARGPAVAQPDRP